jgi:hypothetical protein
MATFRFGRDVNIKWQGNEIQGPAGTVFTIADSLYDEFNNSVGHAEPTLEWLVTNELGAVQAQVAGLPVSATAPISATTTTAGTNISLAVGTTPANYVLASNGAGGASFIAAAGAGVSSVIGTSPISASASTGAVTLSLNANYSTSTHNHDATYQVAGSYSTSTHTHTSLSNNLQINKADSKVQLLNTTSGSGTEDGLYLQMADTDVGYLWNAETNGALVLGTGGAERARITPAGKFGIGTNTPAHQLEVVGPASVTVGVSAGGSGFAELELVGQAGKNYITSDDTLSFDIGGTERATVATTGFNVTSGTLSQGGTAVSLSTHTHAYQPSGTYVTAVNGTAPISASTDTAGIVTVGLSASYASSVHTHATSSITSGNFVATLAAGTGVTVTGADANAAAKTVSIGQAVATSSSPTFNALTVTTYPSFTGSTLSQYDRSGSADTTTITTAGTQQALTSAEISFTPQFVGQRWLFTFTGYASLNTTVIQYAFIRCSITDSSNNIITSPTDYTNFAFTRSENFGTTGRGSAVAISKVWVADTTSARKFKLYGTTQTTNGLILSLAYTQLTAYPIG